MSGVRQDGHTEDVQEQVQLPEARVPVPRRPPAESVPVPGVRQGVLSTRQDEEPHEDRARVLHAQGHRLPASAVPTAAVMILRDVLSQSSAVFDLPAARSPSLPLFRSLALSLARPPKILIVFILFF